MISLHLTKKEKVVAGILLIMLIISLAINIAVKRYSAPYLYGTPEKIPHAEAAILLGAAVYQNGKLTPVLEDRALTAIALYEDGKVSKILVSGDNAKLEYNEVIPVSKFLIARGIPEKDIFLDYAGFDTYDSMYRARDVFKVESAIVITQNFHLYRSVYIARHLGIDAYGLSADKRQYFAKNYIREYFARVKAFGDILFHSKPTFLGDPVPITNPEGNIPKLTPVSL